MQNLTGEDRELLRDTASRFFDERAPIAAMRELRDKQDPSGFDRALWREMAEMGWAGILLEEDDGGIDFGYSAFGDILECSGRTLTAAPFISTVLLGAKLVERAGNVDQRAALLPAVAAGEMILAVALDERPRHAPQSVGTSARATESSFIINGKKIFVIDGHVADKLIVVARSSGALDDREGLSLFCVDAADPNITITRANMVDGRNAASIEFNNLEVPADALLGSLGDGFAIIEPVLDGARAGIAAEMLGVGLEAFERTIEYLKVREQFGAPIGSFQALKHRAAEMYCEIELARSSTFAALEALDCGDDSAAELASLAKTKACEMLELVSNEAVQMHGGIGMTDEADLGLFLKRARVAQHTLGDADFHRDRYAQLLGL